MYGAPLVIIVCVDHQNVWRRPYDNKKVTDIDATIVTDHMMLAATYLGLGTVWICFFNPDVIAKEFGLPSHIEPINILAIGYANTGNIQKNSRKTLSETVSFEHYDRGGD